MTLTLNKKIEYTIFIILLFLQNFAVITTKEFGINGLVCFLFVISILQSKKYYLKIDKKMFYLIIGAIGFLIISSIVNDTLYIFQIFRYIMIIWLIYVSNKFIQYVYKFNHDSFFWKIYTKVLLIFLFYGIYELIANIYSLPLFLNILGNNPSYEVKSLYRYFGGWINKTRLYNAFFEPSVFSIFLVYNFFLIKENKNIKKNKKRLCYSLILFNFFFTYARTGYVTMIYMILIYIMYRYIVKDKNIKNILDGVFLLLPFFNLFIMNTIGTIIYTDLSSLKRTYSALYYLHNSFGSVRSIIFGHSVGTAINSKITSLYIERQAHNGYIDIIYQFGLLTFIILYRIMLGLCKKINNKRKYLVVGVLSTFCCLGNYFSIETIIVLVVMIYNFCRYEPENIEIYKQ